MTAVSRAARVAVDALEPRLLLNAAKIGTIPASISPSAASQTLLAPGQAQFAIAQNAGGPAARYYAFTVDGSSSPENVQFGLAPTSPSSTSDAALALYDGNGNLLSQVDADPTPSNPGAETLQASVKNDQTYILAAYFGPAGPPVDYALTVQADAQNLNPSLAVNPATGGVTYLGAGGGDAFDSPHDVDYYPLSFLNAGAGGTVTVSPQGMGVTAAVTLFRRDDPAQPWVVVNSAADAAGNPVSVAATPSAGRSLTDSQYMLAVAPQGYAGAAGAYQITLSSGGVVGPAQIASATPTNLGTLGPISLGTAGADVASTLPAGGEADYAFRAPATGTVTITLQPGSFQGALSLYNGDGATLEQVATNTTAGGATTLTFQASADAQYRLRVGDVGNDQGGAFTLSLRTAYQATNLALTGSVTTASVQLDASTAGTFYHLQNVAGTTVLVLQLDPGASAGATMTLFGPNLSPVTQTVSPGQKLLLPVNVSTKSAQLDLYVGATSGSGTGTLTIGQLDLPATISPSSLGGKVLNLSGATTATGSTGGFGTSFGLKYYSLITSGNTTITATGAAGSAPVLARYEDDNGVMRLVDVQPADAGGTATLTTQTENETLEAIIAYQGGFGGGGSATIAVTPPPPQPVGVGTVPDLTNPGQAIFQVRSVTLKADFQQHLWATSVPADASGAPTVTFTPDASAGSLQATVTAYFSTDLTTPIASATNVAGQAVTFALPGAASQYVGKTIVLRVVPVVAKVGEGTYTLKMTEPTPSGTTFLFDNGNWYFPGGSPPAGSHLLPSGTVTDVVQDINGDGSAAGQFTSSTTGTAGSLQVYRFWATQPGQIDIQTSDIDPSANTTIQIYQAHYDANHNLDYLTPVAGVSPDLDWYPADRSQIDSRIHFNNFNTAIYPSSGSNPSSDAYNTGGGEYYVIVRNEQGTLGRYKVTVDGPAFQPLSGNVAAGSTYAGATAGTVGVVPQAGGSVTLNFPYLTDTTKNYYVNDFMGYFPVQLPAFHGSTLSLSSSSGSKFEYEAYDADNPTVPLQGNTSFGLFNSTGGFTIPAGAKVIYLRVKELGFAGDKNATVTVSCPVTVPSGESAPPSTVANIPAFARNDMLQTSPTDGALSVNLPMPPQFTGEAYSFETTDGNVDLSVLPSDPNGAMLNWGVYIDGNLAGWNQTQVSGGQFVAGTTTGTYAMPNIRQPAGSLDASENQHYHEVTIYLVPIGTVTAGSTFTLSVNAARPLPLVNQLLTLDPRSLGTSVTSTGNTDGDTWFRLSAPTGISGPVTLDVSFTGLDNGSTPIRYDLYDADGNLVTSQIAYTTAPNQNHVAFDVTSYVLGGQAYFVRAGSPYKAMQAVTVKVSGTLIKNFPNLVNPSLSNARPPATTQPIDPTLGYSEPPPDGSFTYAHSITTGALNGTKFWVSSAGVATFHVVTSDGSQSSSTFNPYIALYRGEGTGTEFITYDLALVDFVNNANMNGDGSYDLSAYVTPGMYAIEVVRADPNVSGMFLNIKGSLPAAVVQDIVVDPNSGIATPPIEAVDYATGGKDLSQYRTTYYHVITPAGSQDFMTAQAQASNTGIAGSADVVVWDQDDQGDYTGPYYQPDPVITISHIPQTGADDASASVQADPPATPGKDFWIGVYRNGLASEIDTSANFSVPQSGTPDLVVQSVTLTPNKGQTHVEVVVANHGFGTAPSSQATLTFVDNSNPGNPISITSQRFENALGSFGQRTYEFDWTPKNPSDTVTYATNVNDAFTEISTTNNAKTVALSTVDGARPTISLTLGDSTLDGNTDPSIWGRYISGVPLVNDVVITSHDADGDGTLNLVSASFPTTNPAVKSVVGLTTVFDGVPVNTIPGFNFGGLLPTAADNANVFRFQVQDVYGLWSNEVTRTAQIVPMPGWLSADSDSITFNTKTKKYDFTFDNKLINLEGTVNDLVGGTFPLIGKEDNQFLAEVTAKGSATLNPADAISAPVDVHVLLKVLGNTIFDQHYSNGNVADDIKVSNSLQIDPVTVDTTSLNITFALQHYNLFNWESPQIPLFSYGIPGVVSLDAALQFSINAFLDAALTFALDPSILQQPQLPSILGLASPTFIGPELDLGAELDGEVEVLGFDIASLGGGVTFQLQTDFGLTSPHNQIVDLDDFAQNVGLGMDGSLELMLKAKLLGFTVWSFHTDPIHLFHAGSTVVTNGPLPDQTYEDLTSGDSPVGEIDLDATPNILIDPTTGKGLYLQLVDTNPAGGATVGNIAFGTRASSGGAWSPLTTLSSPDHDDNLIASFTHDGANAPAVVVYQATDFPGAPESATRNAFLDAQDLRYRYWNGTSWSAEQAITSDSLYDSEQALAFNKNGDGVLAWVHNGSPVPLDSTGALDRTTDEIEVSVWNKATHSWTTPVQLTHNSVGDANPTVYADENGKLYVAWTQDLPDGTNQIMYATYANGTWSTPAALPTGGLIAGGKVGQLAFGSSGPGAINLLFTDTLSQPGQPSVSRLFSRPSTLANFGSATNVQTVASDANFSHLRTTNGPDGSLIAYWQQSDGNVDEVYTSKLTAGPNQQSWSTPTPLTSGDGFQYNPSLAIDTDGTYQLVYQPAAPVFGTGTPSGDAPVGVQVGAGVATSSRKLLPELSFSNGLHFVNQATAQSGTTLDGMATLVNTGLKGDNVEIDYYTGTPGQGGTLVGTQTIYLPAGGSFDIHHPYTILAGQQTYAIQVKALGGAEAVTTTDDVTTTTLAGLTDLTIDSVTLSNPGAKAGQAVNVQVVVRNDSNLPINGPFSVSLDTGNPSFGPGQSVNVGVQQVASLGAGQTITLSFPWTIPSAGGDLNLTATADSTNAITEGNENNNTAPLSLDLRADAAVRTNVDTGVGVTAAQLNSSGVNNVQVSATVVNAGKVNLANLDVHLYWALNNGTFVDVGHVVIPSLTTGSSTPVTFTVNGYAGMNHYRVVIDPKNAIADVNLANNAGQAALAVEGLPDLTVGGVTFSPLPLAQSQATTAAVTINNLGIAGADNFTVEIFDGNPATGTLLGKVTVPHIDPLGTQTVGVPIDTSNLVGSHSLTIIVDRADDVLELSELNNTNTQRVTFLPKNRVVDRHVFYNNSKFDGNDAAANASDDAAIATDKTALLPGQTATFANYTSYSKGINGIMVDIANLPGTPSFGDFLFKVGTGSDPTAYVTAPKPTSITVRKGAGTNGSDRVTIVWPDNAIQKQWLQVTVLATANTGLAANDVFYFGNAIGETGNSSTSAGVDTADDLGARSNKTGLSTAPITDVYDFNRDGRVDAQDELIARSNHSGLSPLQLISPRVTSGGALPEEPETTTTVATTTEPPAAEEQPAPAELPEALPIAATATVTTPVVLPQGNAPVIVPTVAVEPQVVSTPPVTEIAPSLSNVSAVSAKHHGSHTRVGATSMPKRGSKPTGVGARRAEGAQRKTVPARFVARFSEVLISPATSGVEGNGRDADSLWSSGALLRSEEGVL